MSKFNPYALKKPCANCPFIKDREAAIELQPGRVEGIIKSLIDGSASSFACHKTTHSGEWVETDDGEETYQSSGKEQQCAGSLAVLEKIGHRTQLMQVMGRMGSYKPEQYIPLFDLVIDYDPE